MSEDQFVALVRKLYQGIFLTSEECEALNDQIEKTPIFYLEILCQETSLRFLDDKQVSN